MNHEHRSFNKMRTLVAWTIIGILLVAAEGASINSRKRFKLKPQRRLRNSEKLKQAAIGNFEDDSNEVISQDEAAQYAENVLSQFGPIDSEHSYASYLDEIESYGPYGYIKGYPLYPVFIKVIRGEAGPPGPPGKPGLPIPPDGRQGISGTSVKLFEGPPGPPGEKGDRGEQGLQGVKGDVGERGERGDVGPIGPDGLRGLKGRQGDRGPAGRPGRPGRDCEDESDSDGPHRPIIHPGYTPPSHLPWRNENKQNFAAFSESEEDEDQSEDNEDIGRTDDASEPKDTDRRAVMPSTVIAEQSSNSTVEIVQSLSSTVTVPAIVTTSLSELTTQAVSTDSAVASPTALSQNSTIVTDPIPDSTIGSLTTLAVINIGINSTTEGPTDSPIVSATEVSIDITKEYTMPVSKDSTTEDSTATTDVYP